MKAVPVQDGRNPRSMHNSVIIEGNLGAPPESRQVPRGDGTEQTVTDFVIYTTRVFKNSAGVLMEERVKTDCTVWGQQAQFVRDYLTTGRTVLVSGRLNDDSYIDKTIQPKRKVDGENRTRRRKVFVVCDNVEALPAFATKAELAARNGQATKVDNETGEVVPA
jgi:single stranded DNA-binding protein